MEQSRDGVELNISFDLGVTILRINGILSPGARTDAMRSLAAAPSAGTKMVIVFDKCEYITANSIEQLLLGGDSRPLLVCRAGGILSRILPANNYYHSLAEAMATLSP